MWVTRDTKYWLTCFIADGIAAVAFMTTTWLLAERFDGIGPWTKFQVLFMLGYGSAVRGLIDMFFGYNLCFISRRLGRGQLDHSLIQPQPLWMSLLTEGFSPFQNMAYLLPGSALMVWSAARLGQSAEPGWIALLLASIAGSCVVMLSFVYLWGSLAFWFPGPAEEINSSTSQMLGSLRVFPLDGLGSFLVGGLLVFLPAGLLAWYPCKCLLGLDRVSWHLAVTPMAGIAFFVLMTNVFRKGLDYYVRTGSQRYSDYGHRR